MRAICYDTTGNLADAQDVAQDVFLLAYEKLGDLRAPAHFGRWLIGIARLRCRQWQREALRNRRKLAELGRVDPVTTDSSESYRMERLREMIRKLPEGERLALHVFYLQGKSAETAHKVMGMSRSGFYRLLGRARNHLENLLSQEEKDV